MGSVVGRRGREPGDALRGELWGTRMGACVSDKGGLWVLKRTDILCPLKGSSCVFCVQ